MLTEEDEMALASCRAKSDQLNASDLLTGPITVSVEGVKMKDPKEQQPMTVSISGGHMPWKPCKGMRTALIAAWGLPLSQWTGRQITLINNPKVKYGGEEKGGIEVAALSHIDAPFVIKITVSRQQKKVFTIQPIVIAQPEPPTFLDKWRAAFKGATPEVMAFAKGIAEAYLDADLEKLAAVTIGVDALADDGKQYPQQIELLRVFASDVDVELRTN